jgi:hypothetical protein
LHSITRSPFLAIGSPFGTDQRFGPCLGLVQRILDGGPVSQFSPNRLSGHDRVHISDLSHCLVRGHPRTDDDEIAGQGASDLRGVFTHARRVRFRVDLRKTRRDCLPGRFVVLQEEGDPLPGFVWVG